METDGIEKDGRKLAVRLGGEKYFISGYGDIDIDFKFSDGGPLLFASPEAIKSVFDFLSGKGFGKERIRKLEIDYAAADKEYHRAKFFFDKEGKVRGLQRMLGYGREERRQFVGSSGRVAEETYVVNETLEQNADGKPLPRSAVKSMIKEAMRGELTEAQKAAANTWVKSTFPEFARDAQQAGASGGRPFSFRKREDGNGRRSPLGGCSLQ